MKADCNSNFSYSENKAKHSFAKYVKDNAEEEAKRECDENLVGQFATSILR